MSDYGTFVGAIWIMHQPGVQDTKGDYGLGRWLSKLLLFWWGRFELEEEYGRKYLLASGSDSIAVRVEKSNTQRFLSWCIPLAYDAWLFSSWTWGRITLPKMWLKRHVDRSGSWYLRNEIILFPPKSPRYIHGNWNKCWDISWILYQILIHMKGEVNRSPYLNIFIVHQALYLVEQARVGGQGKGW